MESGFLKGVQKTEMGFLCYDHTGIHGGLLCSLVQGTYRSQKLKFLDYRRKFSFKS